MEFLINLIDSPGHVDFSSEVTAALRVTDGGLVVVDCVEGVCVQTETVLRQALGERIRPVMTINKLDRCFLELMLEPEEAYNNFQRVIENANVIIATYTDEKLGDLTVYPEKGTVSFSAGLHAWAFTLTGFASMYAKKFGIPKEKMMQKLWGDNFFDPKTKKWTKKNTGAPTCQRGFCQFVYAPIKKIIDGCMNDQKEKVFENLSKLGVLDKLKPEDKDLTGKPLMKRVMQTWLPAHEALLEMMIFHLPSPAKAQKYRAGILYEGPSDDPYCDSIRRCDPEGPLMLYVSKMIPASDKGRFFAFGRVYSGTVGTGQKVRIMGANYEYGTKKDLFVKSIQRTVLCMGRRQESVDNVPCGNTVALVGLDQFITKTATITNDKNEDCHPMKQMKYSVSPVVKVAVKAKDGKDLPKLVEGLKKLSKSDPLVICTTEESGEHVIAGCGELHVEICLKDLRDEYAGCDFVMSDPVVSYRETVQDNSSITCLAKSPNKHNRIYLVAEKISEELCKAIEDGTVGPKADPKERMKTLRDKFEMDENAARKIWAWGPETEGANIICDVTQGVQYVAEIKEHVTSGFQWTTKEGPLCEENMRGIRFNIEDVTLHSDAIHRGAGQIMPPTRRACFAGELTGKPTLQEPVFLVEITCPQPAMSGVYNIMNLRRGCVFEENPREGTPIVQAKAHLPVAESFGFVAALRQATSGQAFPQCIFDHWEDLEGDAMQTGSKVQDKVLAIRKRKNIAVAMPALA